MRPISAGDVCEVIGGVFDTNVGIHVKVISLIGDHSLFGRVWKCEGIDTEIVTEYGAKGKQADFAQSWLRRIDEQLNKGTKESCLAQTKL